MRVLLKNFRILDEDIDSLGSLSIEGGLIKEIILGSAPDNPAALTIDGLALSPDGDPPLLMHAFVDLHAHVRDSLIYQDDEGSAWFPAETLESTSLAAAAGGFGTLVSMANSRPVIDTITKAAALKNRCDSLGLIDLYPVLSLTKNLEGRELSEITALSRAGGYVPLLLSEDGRDLADDDLFLAAMKIARELGIPISCHCDYGGAEAEAAKKAGQGRGVWSRIEENRATERAIALGKRANCPIHIAHVSTKEAMEMIIHTKDEVNAGFTPLGFRLSCEVMPHNLSLTEADAEMMGAESYGRVNPPLRQDEDRRALMAALAAGQVDAIATDHAPHKEADKAAGMAGFTALETAFAAAYTELVRGHGDGLVKGPGLLGMQQLSSLMSARPARILGFGEAARDSAQRRGRIAPGYRADLVAVDIKTPWLVDQGAFMTRGKNSPFQGRQLYGRVLMTLHRGQVVYTRSL